MKIALLLAAAGVAAAVLYRMHKASKFGVPLGMALTNPFVPIGALQPPNVRAVAAVETRRATAGASSF